MIASGRLEARIGDFDGLGFYDFYLVWKLVLVCTFVGFTTSYPPNWAQFEFEL